MNSPTIVIEPTDSSFKVLVGYVFNQEPIILYAASIPMNGFIKNGSIVDIKQFSNFLKDAAHIEDRAARAKFDIHQAILVLPPVGLDIYEDHKSALVVGTAGKVEKYDIANVLSMIQKEERLNKSNVTVDIVPLFFYVTKGKTPKIPIGVTSDSIGMKALIYSLPSHIVNGYKTACEASGIYIQRNTLAPAAIANLLSKEKDIPNAYIYVDIGSTYTTLSLISKTYVYSSLYFNSGSNQLTKHIAESFNIDFKEAEKLKRRYGYNQRIMSFNPVIASSISQDGKESFYTLDDLKIATQEYLDNYIYSFDTCLNKLLTGYPEDKKNFPLIFGGGGSRLDNIISYFKDKYPNRSISKVPLKVLGARHEKYLNLVGALLLNSTYTGSLSDNGTDFKSAINRLKKTKQELEINNQRSN